MRRCTAFVSSRRAALPKLGTSDLLLAANALRSSTVNSNEPTAPSAGVGMNALTARSAVRTLHDGCQCSG